MDPPRKDAPVTPFLMLFPKSWHNYASHGAHLAVLIQAVPYMGGVIGLIVGTGVALFAIALHFIAVAIYLTGSVGRADSNAAPFFLQRLKQLLAKLAPRLNGKLRIVRCVVESVYHCNFGVEHVSHEE